MNGTTHSPRRCAMTLIELLIVFSIIGVLIALILPALTMVRETARCLRCQSKLRDLGIAIRSYHEIHDVYPLGMGFGNARHIDTDSLSSSWSMHSFLLPYLEQGRLHDLINFEHNVNKYEGTAINQTPRLTQLSIFLCPSDPTFFIEHTGNNYVACVGPDYYVVNPLGMFGSLLTIRDRDVVDGLSHTIAMSERIVDWGNQGEPSPGTVYYITGEPSFDVASTDGDASRIPNLEGMIERCDASTSHFWYYNGRQWSRGGLSWTLFNTIRTPNQGRNCRHGNDDAPWERGILPASSHHPGGVNTLFADGSVEFVSDSIDLSVYRAMGTRDGFEVANGAYTYGGEGP